MNCSYCSLAITDVSRLVSTSRILPKFCRGLQAYRFEFLDVSVREFFDLLIPEVGFKDFEIQAHYILSAIACNLASIYILSVNEVGFFKDRKSTRLNSSH